MQGWRRLALASGLLIYPMVTAYWMSEYTRGGAALTGYTIVVLFCAVCATVLVTAARGAPRRTWSLIGAMTLLFLAALPFARDAAFYLCTVVVSCAVALARRRLAWIIGAGVLASLVVPPLVPSWHTGPGWLEALTILFTSLTLYSSLENADAFRALYAARLEVARLASESERFRLARDLHDLLGHSLTTITVKSGLARRLAAAGSPLAVQEITEVEQLSRQALADVRAAVSGYREVTLAGEIARGKELLRALGITADFQTASDILSREHQELFGWAVREGLTNVARHARAGHCAITVSATEVEIRDDGSGVRGAEAAGSPATTSRGSGLAGLRERAEALGATVTAGPLEPRGWRLRVSLESMEGGER